MANVIPIMGITRSSLLVALLRYKKIIRLQLARRRQASEGIAQAICCLHTCEADGRQNHALKIKQLELILKELGEAFEATRADLAATGRMLGNILPVVDRILTFHDKCQLLNISHQAASTALNGVENTSFERMIFVHVLEYRGTETTLPAYDISMPFWTAMYELSKQVMQTN